MASSSLIFTVNGYENYINTHEIDEAVINAMAEAARVAILTEKDVEYGLKISAKAKELVENAIENSKEGIMILEQFMPWEEAVLTSTNPKAEKINFVVFPSNRGGFCVHTVPKELGSFENRKSLPKEWAGLRDEKLQEVSKIKTAKFCHNACFICTAETKEDAIKMAEIAQRA